MSSNETPRNYARVSIPDVPPAELTYQERRAEILQLMGRRGSPNLEQSQAELAARYDVSQQQISKDFKRIRESLRHHLGDDIELRATLVFEKAIDELQEEGDHYQAAKLMTEWLDWLADFGHLNRKPDRQEIEHSGQVDADVDHDVDADDKVRTQLTETDREHFAELIEAAERQTAATRVDANGDDLSAEDLGLDDPDADDAET